MGLSSVVRARAMADTVEHDFRRAAALVSSAEMEAELARLKLDRENNRRVAEPVPKLAPKVPGGFIQPGADAERMAAIRARAHKREKRIRVLELSLGKSGEKTRGRTRSR